MPINEDKTWEEAGNDETGGNGRVREAFKNGTAKKVLLAPAFKLYKFNEYKTLTAPDSKIVSPWVEPLRSLRVGCRLGGTQKTGRAP